MAWVSNSMASATDVFPVPWCTARTTFLNAPALYRFNSRLRYEPCVVVWDVWVCGCPNVPLPHPSTHSPIRSRRPRPRVVAEGNAESFLERSRLLVGLRRGGDDDVRAADAVNGVVGDLREGELLLQAPG